ncbi:FAD-dependent monooxygenase [Saccharopolyspora taberi]|uniref:FAD-dependent monooxygenase n=1 Tax=Saccharopolyspora taberi TaxID=60895 RepID=A0ABN3VPJ1_9PSEU
MKICCVGAGPAGLYFAISVRLRDPDHEISIIERDPPGATYGWGVVYWDDLLDVLYRNDRESAQQLRAASTLWQEQEIRLNDADSAYLGGYGYSLGRAAMLDVLARRAQTLGVKIEYQREITDPAALPDADLIVGSDGVNSKIRQSRADVFGTRTDTGSNPYIWLGTDKVFDRFTFAFEETPQGWIWFHAYPSSAGISTCIVECTEQTWRNLGLDSIDHEEGIRLLERIFERPLEGHRLISQSRGRPAQWLRFTQVRNESWIHDNIVLIGDAAHTTHFTIGSGTRLAMLDAINLAQSLYDNRNVEVALRDFDQRARAALRPIQAAARSSMAWFERADQYLDRDALSFSYSMASRHEPQPPWQYQLHRVTQVPAVRKGMRYFDNGRRWFLALRRGESVTAPIRERLPLGS